MPGYVEQEEDPIQREIQDMKDNRQSEGIRSGSVSVVSGSFLWVWVSVASEISRWLVECVGVFVMGVCRLLRRLVGSLWNVSVCLLWVVCRLLRRLVGSLWDVSVCF